ncbi:endonuclease V [candidate division TM6 bacterium JCVI TM6SC1]|uniref:Endonuclease V n=1 Tax=candidate division TM6 bacterium JCVI TM6SC1 TaxID=1306947 RepID=A0A0D2GPQ5_9BACT|nr:endonuclease V [candidate division TM6 bacterium JCVI TM6SC1]
MIFNKLHEWNVSPEQAIALQRTLASQIVQEDYLSDVQFIAGVDMALSLHHGRGRAAVVVLTYPDLHVVEEQVHEDVLLMPYIPGLLSFRELPCILGAFEKLVRIPDLIMVDGMGIAHPRRLGIACHLGLWLNIPTIGCGKSILAGKYDHNALSEEKGSCTPLISRGTIIGQVVRTRTKVAPLFISSGHLISLKTSVEYVLACATKYRLPEPTRLADKLSKDKTRSL